MGLFDKVKSTVRKANVNFVTKRRIAAHAKKKAAPTSGGGSRGVSNMNPALKNKGSKTPGQSMTFKKKVKKVVKKDSTYGNKVPGIHSSEFVANTPRPKYKRKGGIVPNNLPGKSALKKSAPVPSSMYGKANQGKTSTGNKSNAPKPKYKTPKIHASQKQMSKARKSMGFK
jgi:hypothetical protein